MYPQPVQKVPPNRAPGPPKFTQKSHLANLLRHENLSLALVRANYANQTRTIPIIQDHEQRIPRTPIPRLAHPAKHNHKTRSRSGKPAQKHANKINDHPNSITKHAPNTTHETRTQNNDLDYKTQHEDSKHDRKTRKHRIQTCE